MRGDARLVSRAVETCCRRWPELGDGRRNAVEVVVDEGAQTLVLTRGRGPGGRPTSGSGACPAVGGGDVLAASWTAERGRRPDLVVPPDSGGRAHPRPPAGSDRGAEDDDRVDRRPGSHRVEATSCADEEGQVYIVTEKLNVWPVARTRWGRPTTARERTSRCSPRSPRRVELCLFDDGRRASTGLLARSTAYFWHAYLPASARAALRLPGARTLGPRTQGQRCNPAKLLLDPYAKAIEGQVDWDQACFALHLRRRPARATTTTAPPTCRRQWSTTRTSTGATTGRPDAAGTRPSSTNCTSRASPPAHPDVPEAAAGNLRRPGATPRSSSTCRRSASPRWNCCPSTSSSTTPHLVDRGLRNYWGYNSIGFFAPHNEYATGQRGRAGRRVQADGEDPARGRHRGDPRRGLQPHGRGQPPGPDAVD